MSGIVSIEKSKPSAVKRLSLLPRFGVVVDFAGHRITYRHAPIAETLINLKERGFSVKNLMNIAFAQFNEIDLTKQPTLQKASPKKRRSSKTK